MHALHLIDANPISEKESSHEEKTRFIVRHDGLAGLPRYVHIGTPQLFRRQLRLRHGYAGVYRKLRAGFDLLGVYTGVSASEHRLRQSVLRCKPAVPLLVVQLVRPDCTKQ